MIEVLNKIKDKAMQDLKTSKLWFGVHMEIINGQEVKAYVSKQQRASTQRIYDAMFCNWYLNGKKSSLAKVLEAIK